MVDVHHTPSLARHLDLMLMAAQAMPADVERACTQAKTLQAAALCVPGAWVALARSRLEDSGVKVCALVSHPWGLMTADVKRYEIEAALDDGAQEFEVMANHALLKEPEGRALVRELRDLVEAADEHPVKVTVRFESLSQEELVRAAMWCVEAEAHCLVLATEANSGLPGMEAVRKLNEVFRDSLFFKVVLPAASRAWVTDLLSAGAMRVGVNVDAAL